MLHFPGQVFRADDASTNGIVGIVAATGGDGVVGAVRRRGKSKAANFTYGGPVAVIRLELDATEREQFARSASALRAVSGQFGILR